MPPRRKPPAKKAAPPKVHVAEDGRSAAIVAGTPTKHVHEVLTGADKLPDKGMELGRPPVRPPFDPKADLDIEEPLAGTPVISSMVFVALDNDGDFERRVLEIVAYAEGKGMINLTATMGECDPDVYFAMTEDG